MLGKFPGICFLLNEPDVKLPNKTYLSNILMIKTSGKIAHIDFGDSFEAAEKRENVPEKVPFRLTRMLVKVRF